MIGRCHQISWPILFRRCAGKFLPTLPQDESRQPHCAANGAVETPGKRERSSSSRAYDRGLTERCAPHSADRAIRSALWRVHLSRPTAWRLAIGRRAQRRRRTCARCSIPTAASARRSARSSVSCCAQPWDVIGVSTTGMTLRFDLELAHLARRLAPSALIVAGGMEATFRPELMFELGPFDRVVFGEGERPLLELGARLRAGESLSGIAGMAERLADGSVLTHAATCTRAQTSCARPSSAPRTSTMPYRAYWERLERAYQRRGAAEQGGARGAPRRDPLGAPHHAQLLSDGLQLLLGHELSARGAGQRRCYRAPRCRGLSAHDRAHRCRASRRRAPSSSRTTSSLSPRIGACCRCARAIVAAKQPGEIPRAAAVHQHQSHRCHDASSG